jgi:hypothetical protein
MPIFDLYSKRQKRQRGEAPDVYSYTKIPQGLRIQIIHIWGDALGNPDAKEDQTGRIRQTYQQMVDILRREYHVFKLSKNTFDPSDARYAYAELREFFLEEKDAERVLDVIELTARAIDVVTRSSEYMWRPDYDEVADTALEELNARFKEHGIGYVYTDHQIIRIDSELIHSDVVKPALSVLRQSGFESAQREFLDAHENYRQGKKPQALLDCYKAFESTMKIICDKRGWPVDKSKGAADLVRVILEKGLVPQYWQGHFSGLRNVLESAIPTPRNKQAGHGSGVNPIQDIPDELVSYVLHLTAATILFLTEANRTHR